jgi:hypothetical protein
VEPAVNCNALLPEPGEAMLELLNAAVIPFGIPLVPSVTAELKPPTPATFAVTCPLPAVATVSEVALRLN